MKDRHYEGVWHLLPELSFYQDGGPPHSGIYEITTEGQTVALTVTWSTDGDQKTINFSGPLDGKLHPSDMAPGGEVSFTQVNADTLESAFHVGGARVAYARRQVSSDGTLMAVLQENTGPDGTSARITQVYRRQS